MAEIVRASELAELMPCRQRPTVLRAEGRPTRIAGLAAVFYRADDPGTEYELFPGLRERIDPAAFDDVLRDDAAVVFNHNLDRLIARVGSTASLEVTAEGLRYSADASGSVGQEVAEMIQRGDVDGSSFRFTPDKVEYQDKPDGTTLRTVRHISRLWDVGPVVFPAFAATTADARADLRRTVRLVDRRMELQLLDCKLRELTLARRHLALIS